MKIFQSSWQDRDGVLLHLQAWEPDERPRAVVGLLHGLGEHVARYVSFTNAMVKAQFAVMGFDLRGHGRSGGRRGHIPSYDALLHEVDDLLQKISQRYLRRPIFLYGHSLGGALAIVYAMKRRPKLQGVISTGPWLRAVVPAPPLKVALARILDPILPTYTSRWAQKAEDLTQDNGVREEFRQDPLVHNLITARLYLASLEQGRWALENASEFPLPLLLMHGSEDRLTSWQASQEFARLAGERCTFKLWNGWFHELHNEPRAAEVLRTEVSWMNRQLARGEQPSRPAGQMRRRVGKSRPIRRKGD